ncbi:N-6 DNA methylase [Mesorhizobium sp. M0195]|uniref:HsdM family class I SAM-dependent methyltransferase n=1 Tax=Mesorhizobium sp. M0195 TaxID=2956910 RepID=UPI00333CC11A
MEQKSSTSRANDGHSFVRQMAAALRDSDPQVSLRRLNICRDILEGIFPESLSYDTIERIVGADEDERHYIVGALYALLMPPKRRRRLSAYFTPPAISNHVVRQLIEFGFNPFSHSVIDPACGGAAFLVPFAKHMDKLTKDSIGLQTSEGILKRIVGVEIEPGLASLSETLIADTLNVDRLTVSGQVVRRGNALRLGMAKARSFDAVVSNPPYGRVFRAKAETVERWSDVISDGHVNTYALFVALSIKIAKPGGLIALIIPTSFIGGPYFSNLRMFIRREADVLRIELIQRRSEAFLDVIQDACILYMRRKIQRDAIDLGPPQVFELEIGGAIRLQGAAQFSPELKGVWALPNPGFDEPSAPAFYFDSRLSNLEEYGYLVRTGFFVWNRNGEKLTGRTKPEPGEVPLIWAKNIKANEYVRMGERNASPHGALSFVRIDPESSAIIRTPSLVVQRTTNRRQTRRLIVGEVEESVAKKYGGYVTENHTIVITKKAGISTDVPLSMLMQLLNSDPVDKMYRQISGTVSVSTKLLRQLPLPKPAHLLKSLSIEGDLDKAVLEAYALTLDTKTQVRGGLS